MRHLLGLFVLGFSLILSSCSQPAPQAKKKEKILVSVVPYKYFVERLMGSDFEVLSVVPAGASPHTYELTARQIVDLSESSIWFRIGEGFEGRLMEALANHGPAIVDLREGLALVEESACSCGHKHHHVDHDLHLWLSPRMVSQQVERMANDLATHYPERSEQIRENEGLLLKDLAGLDEEMTNIFSTSPQKTLFVAHPALAYLCRDYGLHQISIEVEGREPGPRELSEVISKARARKVKRVFVQREYSSRGAFLLAEALGLEVCEIDPYSADYIANMKEMARSLGT